MKLLTKKILKKLPKFYETEEVALADKKLIVKFFDPCGFWTWYGVEYDSEQEVFFGYVEGYEKEWGYFSLAELKSVKTAFGLGIERDMYFKEIKFSELGGK
tara:strand:+ start:3940 stop:4242 length:303 start_codon:yes stop_codon:yes gene_type:complete